MQNLIKKIVLILQILCVGLLLQSLAFKVMAVPSEVAIFRKLEMDPTGRIISIVVEVFCIVGLCTARIATQAAVVAILIFTIGVFFQLTELEIEWWGDGGLRFYLNLLGFLASIGLFFSRNYMSTSFYRKGKAK
jgi:hypothetical protein